MTRVILADDHQIVIDGLKALLAHYPGELKVVGEALNGMELVSLLEHTPADLVFADIEMPKMNGIEAAKEIRKRFPAVKIIALTMYNKPIYIRQMLEQGIDGYVLKNTGKEVLFNAINAVLNNENYFDKQSMKNFMDSFKVEGIQAEVKITKRELEVLKCIALGQTTFEISENLCISTHTVETHRKNLLSKLQVKNSSGLVRYAIKIGLIA